MEILELFKQHSQVAFPIGLVVMNLIPFTPL
jgi:hypothetical protein